MPEVQDAKLAGPAYLLRVLWIYSDVVGHSFALISVDSLRIQGLQQVVTPEWVDQLQKVEPMNQLIPGGSAVTMTSREIADLVESRHDKVKQSIDRLVNRGVISKPPLGDGEKSGNGIVETLYLVSKRDSYVIVAQLSPEFTARLVDRWQFLEDMADMAEICVPSAPAVLSAGEMFLQSAQLLVAIESRAAKMEQAQAALSARLDVVAENATLKECPANAEPISHIRKRISKRFGLPVHIIDSAMRQLPYSPKPAGLVLNPHEGAEGSHYAVFWTKDVSAMFNRFALECTRETASKVTHPFIECRFKLNDGAEGM